MDFIAGVIRVANADMSAIIREAHARRISTYTLMNVTDRDSFFNAVRATLPLDPFLRTNRSWDALSDSLSAGLTLNRARAFLIAWPHEEIWDQNTLDDREIAREVLESLAVWVSRDRPQSEHTKRLTILIGSDPATR